MVRVWYEPPPYHGVGTDLNRTPYGIGGGGTFPKLLEQMAKSKNQFAVYAIPTLGVCALSYLMVGT
jgi:hypothetical protein